MKTIAVVPITAKAAWKDSTQHLLDQLCGMDVEILIPEGCQETMQQGCIRFVSQQEMIQKSEMLLSLGGDGTLMRAAKYAGPAGVPVLGINMGHLGYLVELEISDYESWLRKVLAGEYTIDSRMMLEVEVIRNGRRVGHTLVLNDAFVARGTVGHMITTKVDFDGIPMNTYMGDGNPLPTFTGEPERASIPNDIDAWTKEIWENLNEQNKISIYVRFTDLKTGAVENRMINKNV